VAYATCPEELGLHNLQRVFVSANQKAAAAICDWTGSPVRLTIDEVCEFPLRDLSKHLRVDIDLLTLITMHLQGELGGSITLTFGEADGKRWAASLLHAAPTPGPDWSELEQSALMETGNIVGCAYINAVAQLIDRELIPSQPYFNHECSDHVLQQTLTAQVGTCDSVLICRTCFQQEQEQATCWLLFIPSVALRTAIQDLPGVHLDKDEV
jgi:chemotaxis protein CheC